MTTQHSSQKVHAGAALLSVILLAVAPPASALQAGSSSLARCSARADTPRRLELPDGGTLSVDVQSVAVSGTSVMAVGRHAYVFPRSANPVTPPTMRDSIIGLITDGRGNARVVPNPLVNRRTFFPRVAAGDDGSFHVLFVTAGDRAEDSVTPLDTATIWYAKFAGDAWTSLTRVHATRGALLRSESASGLLERSGDLSFLFPFVDRRNAATSGGVVLLRRMSGAWTADTLRTYAVPKHVRAVYAPTGESILAAIVQAVPRGNTTPAEELYLARFDTTWREPRRAGGDGRRPVTMPVLATVGNGIIASWIAWQPLDQRTSRIEWLRAAVDERPSAGPTVASGTETYPFEMVGVNDRYPLWLYHGPSAGRSVALTMADDSIVPLGSLTMPFENPRPAAVAVTPTRLLVFTMKQGRSDNEPMAASYTTAVEIRCPRAAQR